MAHKNKTDQSLSSHTILVSRITVLLVWGTPCVAFEDITKKCVERYTFRKLTLNWPRSIQFGKYFFCYY